MPRRILRRAVSFTERNDEERRKRSPVTIARISANEPETYFRPEFKASFGTEEFFSLLAKTHIQNFSLDAPNQAGPWTEALEKVRFLEALSIDYLIWEVLSETNDILKKETTDHEQMLRVRSLFGLDLPGSRLADPISEWRPDSELPPESSVRYVEGLDSPSVQTDGENEERTDQAFLATVARNLKRAIQFVSGIRDDNHAAGLSGAEALREIRKARRVREFNRWPRLIAAYLGSMAFLIPMLIMALDPPPKKNIITASVFVVAFAMLIA
ncbi:hypothetical protein CNMCM5793_004159 [Aspergillus hiratsukae]|uniref:Uncharacterized protein n=1 Tax=Aspergillus hiratsukae TaxID=1194566 RepID=A0A8H6P431_9EURO|nr:hypothetical protein CNMCM5793_004159 [Aspergillus hiratsukae]KAF7159118.1 hypothetical protein CNMCM6106_006203 [Aspergillus hiratsukae]